MQVAALIVIVIFWFFGSLFWGNMAKVIAGNRGLNERIAFKLGFFTWFVGLVIVVASHPDQPMARSDSPTSDISSAPRPKEVVSHQPLRSVGDEVAKLVALRNSGDLSADEFDEQKKTVLGK
jgi:hypothetical protein